MIHEFPIIIINQPLHNGFPWISIFMVGSIQNLPHVSMSCHQQAEAQAAALRRRAQAELRQAQSAAYFIFGHFGWDM